MGSILDNPKVGALWLISGVVGAWLATTKGRGGCLWFSICSTLGPFGVALALFLPSVPKPTKR